MIKTKTVGISTTYKKRSKNLSIPKIGRICLFLSSVFVIPCAALAQASCPAPCYKDGGGNFGSWDKDEFRLPVYHYQAPLGGNADFNTQAPYHQLGNSAITANAHVDGYVELFTTRTFPRFANKYNADRQAYAGGFGWVQDRETGELWSTLNTARPEQSNYSYTLGIGYTSKNLSYKGIKVTERVFVPNGDDEVIMVEVTLENVSNRERNLSYYSYWDVDHTLPQFNVPPHIVDINESDSLVTEVTRNKEVIRAISLRPKEDLNTAHTKVDPSPKTTFLSFLSHKMDGFETSKDQLFDNSSNSQMPLLLNKKRLSNSVFSNDEPGTNQDIALVAEKQWHLAPGQTKKLTLIYGISPTGESDALIAKYKRDYRSQFDNMLTRYERLLPKFETPKTDEGWLRREMLWSSYYLLSGVMREDYFGEQARVLNQSSIYMYDLGLNISLRDPLQHIMPLIYIEPDTARQSITYVLRTMLSDGRLPYGAGGYGLLVDSFEPSDLSLWVTWAMTEYVFATRDFAYLRSMNTDYEGNEKTNYDLLKLAVAYQLDNIGRGDNGLIRIRNSDWNDMIVKESGNVQGTRDDGESTMNTAIALIVYPKLKQLAEKLNDSDFANRLDLEIQQLTVAMKQQWQGEYFNRAYSVDAEGQSVEIGADTLWLESNGLALLVDDILSQDQLCGHDDPADGLGLVSRMKSDLSDPSAIGFALTGPLAEDSPFFASPTLNSTWFAISGPSIRGLAKQGERCELARDLAWTEFKKNTLANHGNLFPDIWYGIWSSSDAIFNDTKAIPLFPAGRSWMEFGLGNGLGSPEGTNHVIANMHSHAQPLFSSIRMAGIMPTIDGYTIAPGLPYDSDFSWESERVGVFYQAKKVGGYIVAKTDDTIRMRVKLPPRLRDRREIRVKVQGHVFHEPTRVDNATIEFDMKLKAGRRIDWSLR